MRTGTMNRIWGRWLAPVFVVLAAAPAAAQEVRVRDTAALEAAARAARPGARIILEPGEYRGGLRLERLQGAPDRPIVITAADPKNPPRLVGGASGLHLVQPANVELRDLLLTGATSNGINIDDGGTPETPAHHVLLKGLRILDVGPRGNRDGLKLSGLEDFRVEGCTVERWGSGGSAIDMVGCHRGVVEGCTFREGGSNGVQCKGGTSEVTVRRNRFLNAGQRAVNVGGSTGLPYFRPRGANYEARAIRVEGNVFTGSLAPICFVGVDGAVVRFNTIYRPDRWVVRILQENTAPGFLPSRNGRFEDNLVVFRTDRWASGGVNIGPGTAPETFRFARNFWYAEDRPDASRPTLPTPETGGVYGRDPLLNDPAAGDFTLRSGSPARAVGATALPPVSRAE